MLKCDFSIQNSKIRGHFQNNNNNYQQLSLFKIKACQRLIYGNESLAHC